MGKLKKTNGRNYYEVNICGIKRYLPLFRVADGVSIALFNILGETELVRKAAEALAGRLDRSVDCLVTPEVKSIPLAYEMACVLKVPYVVARKIKKPYMTNALGEKVVTITTGKPQTIWLDGKDRELVKDRNVALVDDVVSTGATFLGLRRLMKSAGANVVSEVAIFTEGDSKKWKHVIALGNLPVFLDKENE